MWSAVKRRVRTAERVLKQPEKDVRGVSARKRMRGSRRAKDAAAHAVGREGEDGRDGQGSFKEAKMGRDITRPVVIRAVARDTLSGTPAQAVGCEGGGRVPGGCPVTKTMDTGRRTGLQGVIDGNGREVAVCCGVGRAFGKIGTRCKMGGKVGNKCELNGKSSVL